jgi:doubled CXXCH motif protein
MSASPRDPKAFTRWFRLDYFRRPRTLRRAYWPVLTAVLLLTGAAAAAGVACVVLKPPRARAVFQAAPVSTPHALFADRCEVCHVEDRAFHTALRFLPGESRASSVSDQACLQCHPAGRHNPQSLLFVNDATGQSQGCTQCHHEHRGDAALARLPDAVCTQCHADLHTRDGQHRYYKNISGFGTAHPEFGTWRNDGKGGLTDPGTVHFSHKAHLELAKKLADIAPERAAVPWLTANIQQAEEMDKQGCAYCHKADAAGRYMQPIRYESHCAACHPLLPQVRPGAWPEAVEEAFRQKPLHHPCAGEDSSAVRGELLDRFSRAAFANPPAAPPPTDEELRPFFLNRPVPPLDDRQRRTVGAVVQSERSLFAGDPKDFRPLPGFEGLVDFDVKGGCAFCHTEAGRSKDGLPLYEPPRLLNRWYPHAGFDHRAHRMMICTDCHKAEASTVSSDVLMPPIENCRQCHDTAAGKARSDCLECHGYHDRGEEHPAAADPPAVSALLKAPR